MRWIAVSFNSYQSLQENTQPPDFGVLYNILANFSPTVSWRQNSHTPHSGWLVEVQGSFRLFGGASALLKRCYQQVDEFHGGLQMANYHTATGAWWLANAHAARSEQDFLAMLNCNEQALYRLPVSVVDTDEASQATWQQCGLHTIGNLSQLPRDAFLKRFAARALAELDSAFGHSNKLASPVLVHQPKPVFETNKELPFHSNRLDLIEQHAQGMIDEACEWLRLQQLGTRELLWSLQQAHEDRPFKLLSAQASDCADTWKRLLHHQLARMKFDDDIRHLHLRCVQTESLRKHNGQLFPNPTEQAQDWHNTCDVLRARLGEETILIAGTQCDPRPERSVLFESRPPTFQPAALSNKTHAIEPTLIQLSDSVQRPLWLLPTPLKIKGKPPSWAAHSEWQLLSGPERIDFGWWNPDHCKRDYYCARDRNASLVWLFKDLAETQPGWYLHGYFA